MPLPRFLVFLSALVPSLVFALEATTVTVTVTATGDAPHVITSQVYVRPGPAGSTYIESSLTNTAGDDVHLAHVVIDLPWPVTLPPGWMLATGGGCMFTTPTLVHPVPDEAPGSTTFLLARQPGLHAFAGFLTWRHFRSEIASVNGRLRITVDGEDRRLRPGETVPLEQLWLATAENWQDLLFAYADEIVRENRIVLKPRPQYIGWSNWDYYGARFTSEQILSNLDRLIELNVGANVLQIDGGWATRSGDYLHVRADLAGGMKHLADEIRRRGLIAGLHYDGMRADQDSQVVREHPEYFLKNQHGAIIGLDPASGRRTRVYFDFSHPGARAHMREAIHTARHEWGYDYFKFDFLKFAFPLFIYKDTPGITRENTRIVPHDDTLTSLERFHLAMATFREAMGDDAYFMACTAEFGPIYGHVDALRTGGDIDPTYSRFSRACTENGGNFYLHRKVVLNDADYIVTRGSADEDDSLVRNPRKTGGDMPLALARMWAHYAGLFGGPKLSGDNLNILREERRQLFRHAVELPACERFVPIDFWQHARNRDDPFGVFLGESAGRTYLAVFNWNEAPREFVLGGMTPAQAGKLENISGAAELAAGPAGVRISLAGHSSAVFQFDPTTRFDSLRRVLTVD